MAVYHSLSISERVAALTIGTMQSEMTEEPTPPPVVDPEAGEFVDYPREPVVPVKPRNPIGWIVSGVLLLLSIVNAVAGYIDQPVEKKSQATLQQELKTSVSIASSPLSSAISDDSVEDVLKKASEEAGESEEAARIAIVAARELDADLPKDALAKLARGKEKSSRAMSDVYDGDATEADVDALEALDSDEYAVKLAKVQAREAVGRPSGRSQVVDSALLGKMTAFGVLAFGAFAGGLVCVVVFLTSRHKWQPVGFGVLDKSDGDRYMFRFAGYMIGFALIGLGVVGLGELRPLDQIGDVWMTVIAMTLTLLFVAVFMGVPIMGRIDSVRGVVAKREPFWRLVGVGAFGYLCTIPFLLVAVAFIALMSKFLPSPDHPINEEIAKMAGFDWLALLLVAAVLAPLIEELAFRGLLFPALGTQIKKPWVAIVVCGLIFAAIHPQGPLAWPALATTGAAAAALRYYTGSLVPSIVLHMVHNGAIMLTTFLIL